MDELEKIETVTALETASMDKNAIEINTEQNSFSKQFKSSLSPKNGYFGETTFTNEYGFTKRIGKTENGSTFHEYYDSNNKLYLKRELNEDSSVTSTYYDDNGLGYLSSSLKVENNVCVLDNKLAPNATIKKGNYTVKTDSLGRPIENKVTDLNIKENTDDSNLKENESTIISNNNNTHIISDKFGGLATEDNTKIQLDEENASKMKLVEDTVSVLKSEGKTVDYEVKSNYTGNNKNPDSFEPKITADGKEVDLPNEVSTIQNKSDVDTDLNVNIESSKITKIEKDTFVDIGIEITESVVKNVTLYLDGKITQEEMIRNIIEDAVKSGAIKLGEKYLKKAITEAMKNSSHELIQKIGKSSLPGEIIDFAIDSYDDISAYINGEIDTEQFIYNLGEHASGEVGSFVGSAIVGAALGSVAGPVGLVAGSIIGDTIGYAIATELYPAAVEFGAENAEKLAEKSQELAKDVVITVAKVAPEAVEEVKSAFTDFAKKVKLPLHF